MSYRKKYTIATLFAIIVLLANQSFIQYWLHKKEQDARIINLSGRQRMLSQKLNAQLQQADLQKIDFETVKQDYTQWQKVHFALLSGNHALQIDALEDAEAVQMLCDLNEKIAFIGKVLQQPENLANQDVLKDIAVNQSTFLVMMDQVVFRLQDLSDKKLRTIILIEILLATVSICVILLDVFFVFKPIINSLNNSLIAHTRSERKLKAVLDNSKDFTVFMNNELKILTYNKPAADLIHKFGAQHITEDCDFLSYLPKSLKPQFEELLNLALKGELLTKEIYIEDECFDITCSPVYSEQNHMLGVTVNMCNIDHIKASQKTIQQQNKDLIRQNNTLKQIAWQQSHEVRRPLANILTFVELLKGEPKMLSEDGQKYLDFLSVSAEELDAIIESISNKAHGKV